MLLKALEMPAQMFIIEIKQGSYYVMMGYLTIGRIHIGGEGW